MPNYRPDVRHTRLGEAFYDQVQAAEFPKTILRFRNDKAAAEVGLEGLSDEDWIRYFGKFEPLPDNLTPPLALRYHGHQFRVYNPDLGDGRGFLFAQMRDKSGRLMDLGTKGSGQTPWSRAGDGRLTLKGGVREVLASEMLEARGVNTSRSFSLIETGEALMRGDEPSPTRSSVLVRLNHSHVRIGTFQRLLALGDRDNLQKLVDYSIAEYWPDAGTALDLLDRVVGAVARLGAKWFAAGFVHGVLNTDNITITGESFDYGPWRFLPVLDPEFTAAYFDQQGLYAFGRQPDALFWNLVRFGECLTPICETGLLQEILETFPKRFEAHLGAATIDRLGLIADAPERDNRLANLFYAAMAESGCGFEQAVFDMEGAARRERIAASPQSELYESDSWKAAIAALRERGTTDEVAASIADRPLGGRPQDMLIEEVESIWLEIAKHDDWQAFENKIAAIRASATGV